MVEKRTSGALPRISSETFKKGIEITSGGILYPHAGIVKSVPAVIEKAPKEFTGDLVRTWVISDSGVDRDDDTINVKGWDLKDYRKGGSVLWAHGGDVNVGSVPIAKPLKTFVEDDKLKSIAEFTPQNLNPFGFMVFQLADNGFVRGSSVGFKPTKFVPNEERDGFFPLDFIKQQLLEWSVTPVPSNPRALDEAKEMGIDLFPMKAWVEAIKDRENYCPPDLTDQDLEIAYASVSASKTTVYIEDRNLMAIFEKEAAAVKALETKANEVVSESVDNLTKTLEELQEVQKRGRVLSSASESKLRKAQEMITAVLDTLNPEGDEPKQVENAEEKAAAEEAEKAAKAEVFQKSVMALVADHLKQTTEEINTIHGVID